MSQPADDPFGGREPTSHERQSGVPWDASYHGGPPPWDIGRPQPAIVRLASAGGFAGAVLDAGCGTGENALQVAGLGLPVLGVDVAETALAIARHKAAAMISNISASLIVASFGVPPADGDSPQERFGFVNTLVAENGAAIRIAHGECTGIVGNLGCEQRWVYEAVIPGFNTILKQLLDSPAGAVQECSPAVRA